jgi:hypothetical protein
MGTVPNNNNNKQQTTNNQQPTTTTTTIANQTALGMDVSKYRCHRPFWFGIARSIYQPFLVEEVIGNGFCRLELKPHLL